MNPIIRMHWVYTIILLVSVVLPRVWASSNLSSLLLLDSAMIDDRIIVVGEHGRIVMTNTQQDWQRVSSGVDRLLTSISSNQNSVLVAGHDAIILHSENRGESWQLVYSDPEYEAPLLDIKFVDQQQVIAIGAYGLYLTSQDEGYSWQDSSMNIVNEYDTSSERDIDVNDLHLNSLSTDNKGLCVIAAESGHVFISTDFGQQWQVIKSPYHGSFFGVEILSDNEVLLYGLRGTIYKLTIDNRQWRAIESNTNELLHASIVNGSNEIFLIGHGATVLLSDDQGNSFKQISVKSKANFTSILEIDTNQLMLTGEDGVDYLY